MIVAAMLWKWIFQDDTGLLNYLLSLFGVGNVGFLTDKTIAIYTLVFCHDLESDRICHDSSAGWAEGYSGGI